MQTDGEAVQQSLTAGGAECATCGDVAKKGTTLKRSNSCRGRDWEQFDHLRGRRLLGWIAAGVASRHTAVSYCGTVSPSGLPVYPPGVGWANYREGRPESRPSYIRGKLFIISRHHDGDSCLIILLWKASKQE